MSFSDSSSWIYRLGESKIDSAYSFYALFKKPSDSTSSLSTTSRVPSRNSLDGNSPSTSSGSLHAPSSPSTSSNSLLKGETMSTAEKLPATVHVFLRENGETVPSGRVLYQLMHLGSHRRGIHDSAHDFLKHLRKDADESNIPPEQVREIVQGINRTVDDINAGKYKTSQLENVILQHHNAPREIYQASYHAFVQKYCQENGKKPHPDHGTHRLLMQAMHEGALTPKQVEKIAAPASQKSYHPEVVATAIRLMNQNEANVTHGSSIV